MIAFATFIAAETWSQRKRKDEPDMGEALWTLMFMFVLGWFDLRMAEILAGGLA